MPPIIEGPPESHDPPRPLGSRLIWFVALWIAGAGGVAFAAYVLKLGLSV